AVLERLAEAHAALSSLKVVCSIVPNIDWFLYGFVRKEAVITSQIEGTQATLQDLVTFEVTEQSSRIDDVREVCNYVDALTHARAQLSDPRGLPLSIRLLRDTHRLLMRGARGKNKLPGELRRSQNWIGGSRPGNARFVPPPPEEVPAALSALERWLHEDSDLPVLVRTGLAHVQFETIHPFLDGNGRIGRLLIMLLVEHWGLLEQPLLYLSLAFRRKQQEYYARLAAVRSDGDWEGWTEFYLQCVSQAATDGVRVVQALHALVERDRGRVMAHERSTLVTLQLFECLPSSPVMTVPKAAGTLELTAPPVRKAIQLLENIGILTEVTGRRRRRAYAYQEYLQVLVGEGK
ncbi:MAG: Fic family protein, partial [Gammaproteobacteria bacterium]|nr:Fic family protein [Gammaproteobacteria bacterium]